MEQSSVHRKEESVDYWVRNLDRLKRQAGFETYTSLAKAIGMTKQGLANVRRGPQELSVDARLKILELLGGEVTAADYAQLFPRKTRNEVPARTIVKVFDPENGENLDENFWFKCIDQVKPVLISNSDYGLARSLGISPTMISNERQGRGGLSTVAKIKILEKLGYRLARDGLINLFPPRVATNEGIFQNLRFVSGRRKRI